MGRIANATKNNNRLICNNKIDYMIKEIDDCINDITVN